MPTGSTVPPGTTSTRAVYRRSDGAPVAPNPSSGGASAASRTEGRDQPVAAPRPQPERADPAGSALGVSEAVLVKGYPWRAAGTRRFEDPDRELRAHGEGDEGEPLFHLPGAGPPTELFMPISDEAGRYLRLRPAAGTVRPGDGG